MAGGCAGQAPGPHASEEPVTFTIGIPSNGVLLAPILHQLTTRRLVSTGPSGRPVPALLQSWTPDQGGVRWRFVVAPNIRLHDGTPVDAARVAAHIREQLAGSELPAGLWAVDGVDVLSATELALRLRHPSTLLLEGLTLLPALRAGRFVQMGSDAAMPTLRPHPYSGSAPGAITSVRFRRYDSPRATWSALLRNEIDLLYDVPNESRALLTATGAVHVHPYLRPYVVALGLNNRDPRLQPRAVRQALNLAVDRAEIIREDFGGFALPASGSIWHTHYAVDRSIVPYRYDVREAARLLQAAGLRARRTVDGTMTPGLRLRCLMPDQLPWLERTGLRLERFYAQVGVALDFEKVPLPEFQERLAQGRFETFLSPVMAGYGLNMSYMQWAEHGRAQLADFGYKAAASAAERMLRAASEQELRDAVRALQRVLHDDPPAVFLLWPEGSRAVSSRFVVPPNAGRDVLTTLADWRLASAPRVAP